jgi:hypothetical protein
MAWKIRINQKPLAPGGLGHNFIVVEDDRGQPYAELNGGPVDKNGEFIPLDPGDLATINSRVSGGVVGSEVRYFPFQQPLNLKERNIRLLQEVPVTPGQAVAAVKAAEACSNEINEMHRPYRLFGTGPEIDHMSETNAPMGPPGFNSNSVASTLFACMGVAPTHPAIESQPGSGQLMLSPSRIQEIRQQYQPASPGDRIPLPPPRPQIRGDNSNGAQPAFPGGQAYRATSVATDMPDQG